MQKTADRLSCQTCRDYEHIIKDACSTDGSCDALSVDTQTKIISRKDAGIYDGMNQAIAEASGRYIYFLNCGDTFADPSILADIKAAVIAAESENASKTAADIVYGNYVRDGMVTVQPRALTAEYLYRRPLNHQSMFVSRTLFEAIGDFDTAFKIRADHEFTLRALKNGSEFLHIDRNICAYAGGGYSEKPENRDLRVNELEMVRARYFSREDRRRLDKKQPRFVKKAKNIVCSERTPIFIRRLYTKIANLINK